MRDLYWARAWVVKMVFVPINYIIVDRKKYVLVVSKVSFGISILSIYLLFHKSHVGLLKDFFNSYTEAIAAIYGPKDNETLLKSY